LQESAHGRLGGEDAYARFAVHAGFALVVDLGRFMQYAHSESALAVVRHLLLRTLMGPDAPPTSATAF
jgi:hypothetical protein